MKKGKGKRQGKKKFGGSRPLMTKTRGAVVVPLATADQLDVKLSYRNMYQLYDAMSGISMKQWNPNCAYDIDPALGSTETPGFDEYAKLYGFYRVIGYNWSARCTNTQAAIPVEIYAFNTNLPLLTTALDVVSGAPYNKRTTLGIAGSGRDSAILKGRVVLSELIGTVAVESADSYRAPTSGTPADRVYLTIAASLQGTHANFTQDGVIVEITITPWIRFYDREWELTISAQDCLKKAMERVMTRKSFEAQKQLDWERSGRDSDDKRKNDFKVWHENKTKKRFPFTYGKASQALSQGL